MIEMFLISVVMVIPIKIHQSVDLKFVHFTAYKISQQSSVSIKIDF